MTDYDDALLIDFLEKQIDDLKSENAKLRAGLTEILQADAGRHWDIARRALENLDAT